MHQPVSNTSLPCICTLLWYLYYRLLEVPGSTLTLHCRPCLFGLEFSAQPTDQMRCIVELSLDSRSWDKTKQNSSLWFKNHEKYFCTLLSANFIFLTKSPFFNGSAQSLDLVIIKAPSLVKVTSVPHIHWVLKLGIVFLQSNCRQLSCDWFFSDYWWDLSVFCVITLIFYTSIFIDI